MSRWNRCKRYVPWGWTRSGHNRVNTFELDLACLFWGVLRVLLIINEILCVILGQGGTRNSGLVQLEKFFAVALLLLWTCFRTSHSIPLALHLVILRWRWQRNCWVECSKDDVTSLLQRPSSRQTSESERKARQCHMTPWHHVFGPVLCAGCFSGCSRWRWLQLRAATKETALKECTWLSISYFVILMLSLLLSTSCPWFSFLWFHIYHFLGFTPFRARWLHPLHFAWPLEILPSTGFLSA